jgi:flagellar biosynthesis protein
MAKTPKASSKAIQRAVALRYNDEHDATPKVIAKGSGSMAERIIRIAHERNVPVRQDPDMLQMLAGIDVMQPIPPRLFQAVAEILLYIYQMNETKLGIAEEDSTLHRTRLSTADDKTAQQS